MRTSQARPVPARFLRRSHILREAGERLHGLARSEALHLADLYEHCDRYYPNERIPPSEGLPYRVRQAEPASYGSPALACVEG